MGSIRIDRRAHASFDASFVATSAASTHDVVVGVASSRFNNHRGRTIEPDVRLEKSVSRFLSPRKRLDPRGTDRSRRPPAQSADGSRHSSARAATAARDGAKSSLRRTRSATAHTDRRVGSAHRPSSAHASRRLPRAATMVRARSSPRHRLFRHIATARPTGSSAEVRSLSLSHTHTQRHTHTHTHTHTRHTHTHTRRVSGSIASVIANPRPRRARLVPRRAASRPASTDLPRLVPIVARFASHRRRTTPSSPRRSRRSTRSARTCLSFSRTTSSSNGTSAWAKAGSAPPTEPSGEVRRPHARRPHTAFFCSSPEHEKTHTESHTRVSNVPSPLTKKPPNVFDALRQARRCARASWTRPACRARWMRWQRSTVRARALARRAGFGRARRVSTTRDNKRNARRNADPTRLLSRFFFSVVTPRLENERDFVTVGAFLFFVFGNRRSRRLTPSTPFHLRHERSLRTIPSSSGLPDIAVRTHGFTSAVRPTIPDDSELPSAMRSRGASPS